MKKNFIIPVTIRTGDYNDVDTAVNEINNVLQDAVDSGALPDGVSFDVGEPKAE